MAHAGLVACLLPRIRVVGIAQPPHAGAAKFVHSLPVSLAALEFVGGVVLLLLGGRLLVSASIDAARRLRVSALVVGLTLVAWGTSAPELALNLVSAFRGRGDLAIGNIVGANICNMALVLGICALIRPLIVEQRLIHVEVLLNAVILTLMATLSLASSYATWAAGLMFGIFGAYSMWTIMAALRHTDASLTPHLSPLGPDATQSIVPMAWPQIAVCFAGGLALLATGGSFASDGASDIAVALGIPAAIVGVTVVSIGTTMPEIVTSVIAVRRGQADLAMGNAIGSCLFNAGAIFGLTGLVAAPQVGPTFAIPMAYMALLAIALVVMSRTFNRTISRLEGAILLSSYVGFLVLTAVIALGVRTTS